MSISRHVIEQARLENIQARQAGEPRRETPDAQQPQWVERRRVRRKAAKKGKVLTPAQVARRLKWEKQQEENRKRAVNFKLMCAAAGLPLPVQEFYFAQPERDWRNDFAWPDEKVVVEVEGGAWSGGRHTRGSGFLRDAEKYNELALRGYLLLRVTPKQLCTDDTIALVKRALEAR